MSGSGSDFSKGPDPDRLFKHPNPVPDPDFLHKLYRNIKTYLSGGKRAYFHKKNL
jgi:hypothetical protein